MSGVRWLRVGGPMAATMAVLLDMGWRPTALGLWVDHTNSAWHLDLAAPMAPLRKAIRDRLFNQVWDKASKHNYGQGLEQGPDLAAARGLYRGINRTAPGLANQILRIWAEGWWDEQRSAQRYGGDGVCTRCGRHQGPPPAPRMAMHVHRCHFQGGK